MQTDVCIASSGLSPTQYQYTGQYSHTADFGLMYYNARWYDPTLGRFAQADSIVPPGVQGLDRYAYVNNNPMRYTDPTGHESKDNCGYYGECESETYTLAGIETVSPSLFGIKMNYRQPRAVAIARFFGNDHVSEGRAKIYPEEAEVLGIDPNTPEGAYIGMEARISDRIEACTGCNETDKLIVAALGSDFNFSVKKVQSATSKKYALNSSASGDPTINWALYLEKTSGDSYSKNMELIQTFSSNVLSLKSQGYYVPNVNFDYVQSLFMLP